MLALCIKGASTPYSHQDLLDTPSTGICLKHITIPVRPISSIHIHFLFFRKTSLNMDLPATLNASSAVYTAQLNKILSGLTDGQDISLTDTSHECLCSIRKVYVEYTSSSGPFITGDILVNYIRNATRDTRWCTYTQGETLLNDSNTAVEGIEDGKCNLVTDTIRADCVDCFDCLRKVLPDLDGTGENENGWSFMAIAAYSASLNILSISVPWIPPTALVFLY